MAQNEVPFFALLTSLFRHTHMYECMTYIYIRIYIHKYIHTYIHKDVLTQMHTCMHTYIHTHIHTDMQTGQQANIEYKQTHTNIEGYMFLHMYIYTGCIYEKRLDLCKNGARFQSLTRSTSFTCFMRSRGRRPQVSIHCCSASM